MIDKLGNCPNCNMDWDDGDILQRLSMIEANRYSSRLEIQKMASSYGYSEENKDHFSKAITHNLGGKTYLQCPKMTCNHVFDRETGETYTSIRNLILGIPKGSNNQNNTNAEIISRDSPEDVF